MPNGCLITVAVAIVVPALVIGGCSVWIFSEFQKPETVANDYMNHLKNGRFEEAKTLTNGDCFEQRRGLADLEEMNLVDYSMEVSGIDSRGDIATWDYDIVEMEGTMTIADENGQQAETGFELTVVSNSNKWVVCGIWPTETFNN